MLTRLKRVWSSEARNRELEEEILAHIEADTAERVEAGIPLERARRAALLAFGSRTRVMEDTRAVWRSSFRPFRRT